VSKLLIEFHHVDFS